MKRLLLVFALVVMMLTLVPVSIAGAQTGEIDYIGIEWDHDPLTVYVRTPSSLQGSQDYIDGVETALNDWCVELQNATGSDDFQFNSAASSRAADITVSIHPGAYKGVLGITLPRDKDRDGYFDSVKINLKVGSDVGLEDFRNVMRHELGHALGLGHTQVPGDLMYPYYNPNVNYEVLPSALDIDALINLYMDDGFGGSNLDPASIPQIYP
ncbi:matrixin family metalloprotease [Chloroflexota bacterium]